jgi:hypothetical protein
MQMAVFQSGKSSIKKQVLLVFLLMPFLMQAQINESDTVNIQSSLTLSGLWQRGNVQTSIFRGRTDFVAKAGNRWSYKNTNSYVYQAFGMQKADEDILSLNFLYLDSDKKVYPLVLGIFSTNYRRQISRRYLLGAGLTFQLIQNEKYWLKLSVSSEFENTVFKTSQFNLSEFSGRSTIRTLRGTLWLNGRHKVFSDKVILTHESYYQPSLEKASNYRWQVSLGLAFPISKQLSFNVNYIDTFESVVVASQQQNDSFMTLGFTLKTP